MTRLIVALLFSSVVLGAAYDANALQSSKPGTQQRLACHDKLGAKHIKKADWKAEWEKCMNDPMDYK
jgi:hypothetical protein